MTELWMKERTTLPDEIFIEGTGKFCPVERLDGGGWNVIVGMTLITSKPPGDVVGEFWFDENGELYVEEKQP